jgi:O-antigen/teichoic acid export membrane protein
MKEVLGRLTRLGQGDRLRAQLVRALLGSGGLQLLNAPLTLVAASVLARYLGPDGYGAYSLALSIALLLAIPARLGLPALLIREISRFQLNEQWGLLRGLLRRATQAVLCASLVLGMLGAVVLAILANRLPSHQVGTIALALILVPFLALGDIRGASLRGFRKPLLGQLPELLLRPLFLLILVTSASFFMVLDARQAMALQLLSTIGAFLVGAFLLRLILPPRVRTARLEYDVPAWRRSIGLLLLVSVLQVVNAQSDILMLGLLRGPGQVGVYRAATQVSMLVSFVLVVVNVTTAPYLARLVAAGDRDTLQRVATAAARLVVCAALPVATGLLVFGPRILSVVFGAEYASGHTAMSILAIGQMVNAATGSTGLLLNMSGYEQNTATALGIATATHIAMNLWLIPLLGIEGAALASATSLALWNVILFWRVRRVLGINPGAV